MAININAPKNIFLMPLFVLLVIFLMPFALFFSLVRVPFANKRIGRLPRILKEDWLPREKYIYIGLIGGYTLSDYVKESTINTYGKYIVWDEWDGIQDKWRHSEPDNSHRITTFWQDIGGEFDAEPMIVIAICKPDDLVISKDNNFYQFWLNESSAVYKGKELTLKESKKKIESIVKSTVNSWNQSSSERFKLNCRTK